MSQAAGKIDTYCYADYAQWPEDVRGDLIDGVFYPQSAPLVRHQRLSMNVAGQLYSQLRGQKCRPFAAPTDVLLPKPGERDDDARTVVQPDLLIVCDPNKITERYVRGAPDFVLEILSPHTARHDQVRKLRVYEQGGVAELWLVDPESRVLTIYRRETPERYGRADVIEAEGQSALSSVPGVVVDWDEAFAE